MREKRENWRSSDEKAQELTISHFGTPEAVREMAKMPKAASKFSDAKTMVSELTGKPLTSRGGLVAFISKNSAKEILSGKSVSNSFAKKAHLLAAVNADRLFFYAVEPWLFELNPEKSNEGLTSLRRLYSPMLYNGKIIPVKLTVKEMKNKNEGNRMYSLKVLDIDLERNIGAQVT